jgi:hypothetical protein
VTDEPNAPGLTVACEVHDSEIIEIERVLERLTERAESRVDYAAFTREARERFEDIGFQVVINWWTTNVPDTLIPEITIRDRIERKPFDYDQQVHEVTHDLLDLGEGGVIKSDPGMLGDQEHKH